MKILVLASALAASLVMSLPAAAHDIHPRPIAKRVAAHLVCDWAHCRSHGHRHVVVKRHRHDHHRWHRRHDHRRHGVVVVTRRVAYY